MPRKPETDSPQINLSQRELVTQIQVNTALQAMGMAVSALGHYMRPGESEPSSCKPILPESMVAVETMLIAACDRVTSILSEGPRWDLSFQEKVEKDFETAHAMQMEALRYHRDAQAEFNTPHWKCRPSLQRMQDGNWLALLGNINDLDNAVIGVGESPKLALEAFDDAFRGVTNPNVLKWIEEKTTINNELQTLDPGRAEEAPGTSQEQNPPGGDSEGAKS